MSPGRFFHIYNRGNNKERIFYQDKNYVYFIEKLKKHIRPHLNIFSFCLMPNHFHLLVQTPEGFDQSRFTSSFRVMLSSYTRAVQRQESRTGSLFQQNTKFKCLDQDPVYPLTCFNYIHRNPVEARLAKRANDWRWSSIHEYLTPDGAAICSVSACREVLDIPADREAFLKMTVESAPDRIDYLL
jgi:REP element-mobilizing transposase RayT